jgi:hypothetical protein
MNTADRVLELISYGTKRNRVTRKMLSEYAAVDDRTVREAIEKLRRIPIYVCATTDRPGYWIGTPSEWEEFRSVQLARLKRGQYPKAKEMDEEALIEAVR